VRENLCHAFFSRAHGKKKVRQKNCLPCVFTSTHGKKYFAVGFFLAHGKHFFPHRMLPSATTVSLRVIFAMR
jgi:hypothetical protein